MKICGIISEYNPFHNGHAYHMEKARFITNSEYIVCVMSGNFTQRGEPALFDKWIRTEAALQSGADIVIELPFLGAAQSAEGFAESGVKILNGIGADFIAFGSECEDMALLKQAASLFAREPEDYKENLKKYLAEGLSYPAARQKAAGRCLTLTDSGENLLSGPNTILAIEYLKAIIKTESSMQPVAIGRTGSGYNEPNLNGAFSSATAIRLGIQSNGFSDRLKSYLPAEAFNVFQKHMAEGFKPVFMQDLSGFILYALRKSSLNEIEKLHDVAEGLENKIEQAAKKHSDIYDLLAHVKSKRYTYTRLCRILLYALFEITKGTVAAFKQSIPYARVLGIRRQSEAALSHVMKTSSIPVITNASSARELLHFDIFASDIYALTQKEKPYNTAKRDLTEKFIKV